MSNLQALELVIDRSSGGGPASREMMKKKLRKAYREGRFKEWVDNPEWEFRLCTANLMLGNFSWRGWEHRHPWSQMLWFNEKELGKPRWRGEEGRVLVLGEQGLGDEIMFSSCLPDLLKTNEIGITVSKRLVSIFQRSFQCEVYDRNEGEELKRAKDLLSKYDYYIGLGDLPRRYRTDRNFPKLTYLVPEPTRVLEMEPYRGRVGISWRGRNGFYSLKDFPEGLSLQYDLNWDEEPEVPHIDLRNDLEGLLALVSVLSKVVCVSTTVAHFAGAVGTPLDVILAPVDTARSENQINWRWSFPWYKCNVYPNMKQWRKFGLR